MSRRDCVILVPCRGPITPRCEAGLDQLAANGYQVRKVWGHTAIDYGRSKMASDASRDGFSQLFWIDSDIGFDVVSVEKLRESGNDFCCGVYPKKDGKQMAVMFSDVKEGDPIHFGVKGGLRECDTIGFGFVYTHVDVYHAIRIKHELEECNAQFGDPITPYFMPMIVDNGKGPWYLPDDYAFCSSRSSGWF